MFIDEEGVIDEEHISIRPSSSYKPSIDVQQHTEFMNSLSNDYGTDFRRQESSGKVSSPAKRHAHNSEPYAIKQELLAKVVANVQGNPFDLEFKLAPILKEWMVAVKANPGMKSELLPLKDSDRPVLKLMRLRECLEHCES